MSQKPRVKTIKTFAIGKSFPNHLEKFLPRMKEIYFSIFNVDKTYDFNNLLKYRGENIRLGLFFDKQHTLCGFAISGIQTVKIDDETHALFSAGAYTDLAYKASSAVVRFALTQSMIYKLKHPTHHLAYLEEALSPAPYSLSATALPECYPSPFRKTPTKVHQIIDAIKAKRDYMFDKKSDCLVHFPIKRKLKNYQRILAFSQNNPCPYYQYYLKQNPKFMEGVALLVYMPLSLENIAKAIVKLAFNRRKK